MESVCSVKIPIFINYYFRRISYEKNVKYLIAVSACLIIGLTASSGFSRGSMSKGLSAQEAGQVALDIQEINNLMSLHSWYHAADMNDVEIKELWSTKRDDIVFAQQTGAMVGRKSIMAQYGKTVTRESTAGKLIWHTVTTPVVEVARDRKTAKGVWYTPGVVGGFDSQFRWMWEKYGVDFVREDGVWKIWHMHVYTDAMWPLNGTITDSSSNSPAVGATETAQGGAPGGAPAGGAPAGGAPGGAPAGGAPGGAPGGAQGGDSGNITWKKPYEEVSPTRKTTLVPRPPVPYNTWSETWSYVDDGE